MGPLTMLPLRLEPAMSESPHKLPAKPRPLTQRKALAVAGVVAIVLGVGVAGAGALAHLTWMTRLGGVLGATGVLWLICAWWRKPEIMRTAQRQFMREFFPAMAGYMVLLPASIVLLQHFAMPAALKTLVVLLPVLPMLLVLRAMLRLLRGLDELQQRIQLQAMGITCAVVGSGTFAIGFLQGAELIPVLPGQLLWVLPAMFAVWGVALGFISRSYRDE